MKNGMVKHVTLMGAVVLLPTSMSAATLNVGPGEEYHTIKAAVAAAHDGDTLAVQAGTYTNDYAEIAVKITLQAIGGRVLMQSHGNIPNQKGILITDTDVAINGFTFWGAHVSNGSGANGAGIRYQGGNLLLQNCMFEHNQDGILSNADPTGTITVQQSAFFDNGNITGPGAGYTHSLYAGQIAVLDVEDSLFMHVNVGHHLKSRAFTTIVNNTRFIDGPTGTSSYTIDLPNGGIASINNAQMEQGPQSQNGGIIAFGEEGSLLPSSSLIVTNSLMENDYTQHPPVGVWNTTTIPVTVQTMSIWGMTQAQVLSGPGSLSNITVLSQEPGISRKLPF
jgi:hypothetical protein